jgi:phosphohistidine phosphatase SixA
MTVYLVRHGSAGVRDDTNPGDDDRRLDSDGQLQARKLAEWLRHEPITRIVSSPYRRCTDTVEPLVEVLGIALEVDDRLAEGTPIEKSWELVSEVGSATVVLCSHGDVIPDVIRRAQLRGMHVPGKSGSSKGSAWTLRHWDGERFATGLYTPIKP